MATIAGIAAPGAFDRVSEAFRCKATDQDLTIVERHGVTLGVHVNRRQVGAINLLLERGLAEDWRCDGQWARAYTSVEHGLVLSRDALGVAPLYWGKTSSGEICFASDVKGLMRLTTQVRELPPGGTLCGGSVQMQSFHVEEEYDLGVEELILKLRALLEEAAENMVGDGDVAAWLSGGVDSSAWAALVCRLVGPIHTFAAGLEGAPDLEYARLAAVHMGAKHHEVKVTISDILHILPQVVEHLETFDSLLIRSSVMNFLVARAAAQYAPAVFSGEGGDELFAGYSYLKDVPSENLQAELLDLIGRLHNTALQRVDRCTRAFGTTPLIGFLCPHVVDCALRIPASYKIYKGVEKWVLREALKGLLPEPVLHRPKAKFWEGAGVEDLLSDYAEEQISDGDFQSCRQLSNGWLLNSKEELWYYRLFCEHFGELDVLDWMGRTKRVVEI